jgi:hypothetical protein
MIKKVARLVIYICSFLLFTPIQALDVCFVTIHPASAEHFARFTEELDRAHISWQILAADSSETLLKQKKIPHRKISIWTNKKAIKDLSSEEMRSIAKLTAKECKKAKLIITDISEPFVVRFHHELALSSSAKRYVYYDNPEPYVLGEYSKRFESLLKTRPDGVLFASKTLPSETLFGEDRRVLDCHQLHKVGLGFYDLEDVLTIQALVKKKQELREKLFYQLGIKDEKQKILTYLGGANSAYFDKAFPFFLKALEDSARDPFFENILLLLQQHPRAKQEGLDLYALLSQGLPFQVFSSPLPLFEVIACSDLMYYYQTSIVSKLILSKRPLLQVSHEPSEDVGVRLHLVDVVSSSKELPIASSKAVSKSFDEASLNSLKEGIGYDEHWQESLLNFIKTFL